MRTLDQFVDLVLERTGAVWAPLAQESVFALGGGIGKVSEAFGSRVGGYRGVGTYVSPRAIVGEDVYIGDRCRVHDFACVRDHSVLLDDVVVGHCTEVARSVVFSGSTISHKVTVCDSLIGRDVNLGASVTLASPSFFNTDMRRLTRTIRVRLSSGGFDTGLVKCGSVMGDGCRVGMNACLAPGVLLHPECVIYPAVYLRSGEYEAGTIVKLRQRLQFVRREPAPAGQEGLAIARFPASG